ncbi:4-hydroxy-3-methylbut-2-enyl diphosphate reductase [Balneicella halophila]|uniref:4-hydroxy-3-methylbut-2-enyl diphosphate reductase n=1 Tax=Balneicella halophila TaxID=1537566 RepID=A0A7L4USW2_BALHA|nr:4-hydroxy-3-methylbut-2-enyl diphosphate reductase [Balneicella halophila]PVX52114.1 4-hydroxy-3-methylbut-2-enyl diphosphate reductase [Balneicella halophila]
MKITIDPNSGYCFGVTYAIEHAERELKEDDNLFVIGDIVHNNKEVERLNKLGLKSIDHEEFSKLKDVKVLLRAHGEPPSTYEMANNNNITLVDASCPVVLNLQKRIKKAYEKGKDQGTQIVIYGKLGHAEVNGLVGQTEGNAIVCESCDDIYKIDKDYPVVVFSQTTKTIDGFHKLVNTLKENGYNVIKDNDTICRKVSNRVPILTEFAQKHDVIIFVGGKKSSNGKWLYSVCKKHNEHSYFVSEADEVDMTWFQGCESVGICGATSTPQWLMEEVAKHIETNTK